MSAQTPDTPQPTESGGPCDWGWCDRSFHSWRWSMTHGWLPVCWYHRDRSTARVVAHGERRAAHSSVAGGAS